MATLIKNHLKELLNERGRLHAELKERYDAGAKTLVMDREETAMVLDLLERSAEIVELTKYRVAVKEIQAVVKDL